MKTIIENLRRELISMADEKTRQSGLRFFKEEVQLYGIRTQMVVKTGKSYYKTLQDKSKSDIFIACEELLKSGIMEESFIACNWSHQVRNKYVPADISIFEGWLDRYVTNWATCDTLCNHSVGWLVEMYPDTISNLKRWAGSDNRWMRRASAVSLIVPAKKGKFLDDIFEIAAKLLTDNDDMVQKGYGWMLKVASQVHLAEVYDFVIKNKTKMPRTALRYAIEKMPSELKAEAMKR